MKHNITSVLHITEAYDGGVVTFMRHVLPALVAKQLKVTLVCSVRSHDRSDKEIEYLRARGVDVRIISMSRSASPLQDVRALMFIRKLIKKSDFEIVHTHCFKAGVLGRIAARGFKDITLIHTPHCFPFVRTPSAVVRYGVLAMERMLAHWTDCLICVSESQHQIAKQFSIKARFCEVVPNGIPVLADSNPEALLLLRRSLNIPDTHAIVTIIGRLVTYKEVNHLVAAARLVLQGGTPAIFLVVGDGPCRTQIEDHIDQYGVASSFRLLGHRDDVDRILQLSNVLVACSQAEGMPYVILEAMSYRIPVIASTVPGHVDLVADEETGLQYPFGDIDALAAQLSRCISDQPLRERVGRAGQQQVFSLNRLDYQIERMLCVYAEARSRRATAPAQGELVPASPSGCKSELEIR